MTPNDEAADVLQRVREALPRLRANAAAAEAEGWIPQENIDLLEQAGVFRMSVPTAHGGLALPIAAQLPVLTEIAQGCGSTGWTALTWVSNAWIATLFPARAQAEVFAHGSVRVSGVYTPSAFAEETEDGYRFTGSWRFNTGCRGADWNLVGAMAGSGAENARGVFALVPMSQLEIADDWDVTAASGTGSATTSAEGLVVPRHRTVVAEDLLADGAPDRALADGGRGYSMVSFSVVEASAVYVGMAQAALELFLERLPGRGLAYTAWTDQRRHPLTQHRVALAANKIDAAGALCTSAASLLQARADEGVAPTLDERARVRGQSATAIELVRDAVQGLQTIAGSSALSAAAPFQRFHRDLLGLATHALMAPDTGLEIHGRVLVGLDPGTPYL